MLWRGTLRPAVPCTILAPLMSTYRRAVVYDDACMHTNTYAHIHAQIRTHKSTHVSYMVQSLRPPRSSRFGTMQLTFKSKLYGTARLVSCCSESQIDQNPIKKDMINIINLILLLINIKIKDEQRNSRP